MKSSPRPPRRFSRWQTTKRTFVLGGAISKASSNGIDQGTKRSSELVENDKDDTQPLLRETSGDGTRNGIGSDQEHQITPGSVKPKHVRKLKLDSSSSTNDEGGSVVPNLDVKTTDKLVIQSKTSHEKNDLNGNDNATTDLVQVNEQTNGNNLSDLVLEEAKAPGPSHLQNLSKSEKSSNALTSAFRNSETKVQTRSSPRKRIDNVVQKKKNNSHVEVVDKSSKLLSKNIDTDKENKKGEIGMGTSHRRSPVKNAGPKSTPETVLLSVSTHSLDNLNLESVASVDNSMVTRTSLRDRSRLKSPAEIMKLRQYPERFLMSSQKGMDQSFERRERKKEKSLNDSIVTVQLGSHKSTSSKAQLNATDISSKSNLEHKRYRYSTATEVSSKNKAAQEQKSKTSNDFDNVSNVSSKTTNSKSEIGHKDPLLSRVYNPLKSSFQSQFEKSIDMSYQTLSMTTKKTKTVKRLDSKQRILTQVPRQQQDSFTSCEMPRIDAIATSQAERSYESLSLQGTFSGTNNVSSERRSLRDRSRLATPDSLQEKRQYPVSFYPSKARGNVLNEKKSAKHKTVPNPKLANRAKLSNMKVVEMTNSLSNKDKQRQQTLLGTTNVPSHSNGYSSEGRSLRDRSKLPTPDSLQEKRQYPVSFYPSKARDSILNASKSAKHKIKPNLNLSTRAGLSNLSVQQHKKTLSGASSKRERKTLTKEGKAISTREKNDDSQTELNREDSSVFESHISKKGGTNHVSPHFSKGNASKKSLKNQALENKLLKKDLSLPRKPLKKSKHPGNLRHEEVFEVLDNADCYPQEYDDTWEINTASVKTAKSRHTQLPADHKSKTSSAIDETILLRKKVPQKRKLVDQLSQAETAEKARKTSQTGKSQKVLLWCGEEQRRLASDVTAYDVIFQAALDVEKELSDAAEDRNIERLVKKVFSGFKRNMKQTIAQELHLKELEKDVRERKKMCKTLALDLAAKHAESRRLQREILSLESEKEGDLQRISQWMRNYSQLMFAAQND